MKNQYPPPPIQLQQALRQIIIIEMIMMMPMINRRIYMMSRQQHTFLCEEMDNWDFFTEYFE